MNKEALRRIMSSRSICEEALARIMHLNIKGLRRRIEGRIEFNLSEIILISKALSLTHAEIEEIFFS